MPGGNLEDRLAALSATATDEDGEVTVTEGGAETEDGKAVPDSYTEHFKGGPEAPPAPVMPAAPPFPSFENTPTLPQQSPGNGYESGRDSRAR
uniref:hypothetical protein n=1 Tax=Paractinoplanes polyasparticus TaxID=2856853 RepID=UPI001C84C705|nr:hypothetical protein [Actinoplanes polyasparticus]